MSKFYFIFGSAESFPYSTGWVEVRAKNKDEAIAKWDKRFGDKARKENNEINCAAIREGKEFNRKLYIFAGEECHEKIK